MLFAKEVDEAPMSAKAQIRSSVNKPVDTSRKHRSRAHRTRLKGTIKGQPRKTPSLLKPRRLAQDNHLGMSGRVTHSLDLVAPSSDHDPILHKNSPDGNLILFKGKAGLLKGLIHKLHI